MYVVTQDTAIEEAFEISLQEEKPSILDQLQEKAQERIERRKLSYSYASSTFKTVDKQKLKGLKNFLAFIFCFIPLFIGFLMPIIEISNWAINYTSENFFSDIFIKSFISNTLD